MRRWVLRPGWQVRVSGSEILLRTEGRKLRIEHQVAWPTDLADALRTGTQDLSETSLAHGDAETLLVHLQRLGAVIELDGTDDDLLARSRQSAFFAHLGIAPGAARQRLAAAKVVLVGVGGTGSVVLQHLVAAGVRRLVLVDFDRVEPENLERQFIYTFADIGRAKVEAAIDYVRARAENAEIIAVDRQIRTPHDLVDVATAPLGADLCILCIDQPADLAFENGARILWDAGIPCIHGGATIDGGGYGPLFDPARSPAGPAAFAIPPDADGMGDRTPAALAFSPANTTIAALIARDALLYLVGAHARVIFDRMSVVSLSEQRFISIEAGRNVSPEGSPTQ